MGHSTPTVKPKHFGLQGVLLSALVLGLQCFALHAQDAAISAYNNGIAAANKGDFDGAILDCTQAIAINPQYAKAYGFRGYVKVQKGDWDGAIVDCSQALALDPNDQRAYTNRGVAKGQKGDWDGDIADCSEALALNPKYAKAYYARGSAEAHKGDLDGAIADDTQAIGIDPNDAGAYITRGIAKEQKGDFDGAIADANQAIALRPNNAGAYNNRGMAKIDKKDYDGAIADESRTIALNPRQAEAYNNRAFAKSQKSDWDGAIADDTQAIALNPQYEVAYNNRAFAKIQKNDLDGAIADCNQAVEINPQYAGAYFTRAIAKGAKGDHQGANMDYNEAFSLESPQKLFPSSPPLSQPESGTRVALGTGFFVTSTGYLLTDFHVVKDASTLKVKIGNDFVSASLVARDDVNDIALLKIDGRYSCLPLGDSTTALLGQTVFTVGFPKTGLEGLSPKLTKGEISSLAGMQDDPRMFQVSVPIQPGNSGGCLADESGNVIGLVESTLSTVQTVNGTGDLLQNVNYATKINYAKALLNTVPDAKSGLLANKSTPAPFTDEVKSVEDATVFIIADSSSSPRPSPHLYKDSTGNTYSVSESDYQRLNLRKVAIDAEGKLIDQREAEFEADARRIEQDRQYLDNTDPQAVDNFNAEVDKHNSIKAKIEQETGVFNDAVDKFNAELRRVGVLIK